jgi:hypothetical protein
VAITSSVFNPFASSTDHSSGTIEYDCREISSNPLIEVISELIDSETSENPCNHLIGFKNTETLRNLVLTPMQRVSEMEDLIKHFKCIIPKVVA